MRNLLLFIVVAFAFSCGKPAVVSKDKLDSPTENELHLFLNHWHKAASTGDEVTFFGSMSKDCVYLGTDASEYWLRDELKEWSAKYFDRDTAWHFEPFDRHFYRSIENENLIWFDEKLKTRMGICRASGIISSQNDSLQLRHYNLSVTISNDLMPDFIKLTSNIKSE